MQLREVMTRRVCSVGPETTLEDAARQMEQLNVGALPVCEGGRVVGMLTDRDIVIRAVASGRDPVHTKVREIQSHEAIVAHEDQSIEDVARLMMEHQIRRIPVVRNGRRIVGIVSIGDLAVKTGDEEHTGQVLEDVSQPSAISGGLRRSGPFKSISGERATMHNRYGVRGDEREGFYGQQGRGEYGYGYEGRPGQGGREGRFGYEAREGRFGYEAREDRFGHEDRGLNEPYGREGRESREGRFGHEGRGWNEPYGREGRFGYEGRGWNEPYGREGRFGQESREGRSGYEGRGWNEPYAYEGHARGHGFGGESFGQERGQGGLDYGRSYGQQGHQGWSGQQGVAGGYGQQGSQSHQGWGSQSHQGWGGQSHQGWSGQQGMTGGYGQPWGQGQSHQGRGPKGYKRSDDRIREDVCDRLTDHSGVDASDIEVKVQNGEITLTGTVPERRIKHVIEQLVESVPGVQDVHNQLRTKREDASKQYTGQADKNGTLQETSRSQEGRRSVST